MATMSEMCLKTGLKFDFEINTSTNTRYHKNCTINDLKMVNCHDYFTVLYRSFYCFVLNIMHGWQVVDFRICFAAKYPGY